MMGGDGCGSFEGPSLRGTATRPFGLSRADRQVRFMTFRPRGGIQIYICIETLPQVRIRQRIKTVEKGEAF